MRRAAIAVLICVTGSPGQPRQGHPVVVFAAASLAQAFNELADSLAHRAPAVAVSFNFAGSQTLALQLGQGAPADCFASADLRWMTSTLSAGLVAGTPRVFAHNRLAVIVPASNPARLATLPDLARPGVKLVLAADAVPAGRYTRQALERLAGRPGFPSGFATAVLANVVSEENNVEAVAAKVSLGEADAGIVYRSDAARLGARVRVIDIPDPANVVADYPIAVLRSSRDTAAAQAFIDAVLSPLGQRILAAHGFDPVRPEP